MLARIKHFRFVVPAVVFCSLAMTGYASASFESEFPRADGKSVPVKIYESDSDSCPPLLVVSHGFGGTRDTLPDLAEAAEQAGYRVIVMEHAESGREVFRQVIESETPRQNFLDAINSEEAHKARFLDLDATWERATRICKPPFAVLAGNSMGAQTTMMEAGTVARIGRLGADRFDAYVALSPQGIGRQFDENAWRNVTKPVLMITGTKDENQDGSYETRLTAFEGLPAGSKRFVVIDNATHRDISGRGARSTRDLIPQIVLEFLENVRNEQMTQPRLHTGVTISDK